MHINARKLANVIIPETGEYAEIDIYMPSLALGIEYQEKHHYITSDQVHVPLQKTQTRDALKRKLIEEKGITLVTIPFWWDGVLHR
jgi:hypothetical protein